MNLMEHEENQSLRATENDQSTRPEVSETIKIKQEFSGGEAPHKSQNPNASTNGEHFFKFTLKSDNRKLTGHGKPNESIYSALRANDIFRERMKNPYNKNILVLEEKTIKGYINLGMPLKCLPTGSKLNISLGKTKRDEEDGQILRECENPNNKIILFRVVAVGKMVKKIVKIRELHKKGCFLISAMKGEIIKEALCNGGRLRSDLDEFRWELMEEHNSHGKGYTVEEVSGKVLELNIYKNPSVRKCTLKKTEQNSGNVTSEISPQDPMPSQIQDYEPERNGEAKDVEQNLENVLPPRSLGHDIEGKKCCTIFRIKNYYNLNKKYRKWPRSRLVMETTLNQDFQTKATDLWLKDYKKLEEVIMQQYPNFRKDALWMRNYFREEQRKTRLPPFRQFNIYKKCFAEQTKNSISVATYEVHTHFNNSVGVIFWDNNGKIGKTTCFVFRHGYIFTCHVVHMMVGGDTNPSLWPDIISTYIKCAKVTFTYKAFHPPAEKWFSIQPWFEVSDGILDYAILKLKENGHGFPPGLFGHLLPLPPSGLVCLIGHPDGRVKEIDECVVISRKKRLERYPENQQREVLGPHAAIYDAVSMFTPRSFPKAARSTDKLTYDTCFSGGFSGSPVFNASGRVVSVNSFGNFYERGGKIHALIKYDYSMESILCDVKEKDEILYKLLTEEKDETLNQEKNNKLESPLQHPQIDPMEY
ncbi:LOW QUALITY PROTEIN: serine protease FAM111B [Rhynchonycteris naso]